MIGRSLVTAGAGLTAAFASALCCAGPLLAVAAGISGAGLASTFEPLRPYFLGATLGFLGLAHYLDYREQRACTPGTPCAEPSTRRRRKYLLWMATAVAIVFATYPRWSGLIL